jgi:hypothetical protein
MIGSNEGWPEHGVGRPRPLGLGIEDLWQQARAKRKEDLEARTAKPADGLWRMLNELTNIVHEHAAKRTELDQVRP